MAVQGGLQVVDIAAQLGRQYRGDARRPAAPGVALVPGEAEHQADGPGAVDQLALQLLQPQLALLGLEHLVGGARLEEGHPAGWHALSLLAQSFAHGTNRSLRHGLEAGGRRALLRHVGIGTPGRLDPLDVQTAIARMPDPPGLLGLADRRLAHPQRTGERAIASGSHEQSRSRSSA